MSEYVQFAQYEIQDDPKDLNVNWAEYPDFGFRASWRIYKNSRGILCREYRTCWEEDVSPLLTEMTENFGKQGKRWDFDHGFLYLYIRSATDFAEFRLTVTLPSN